MLLLVTRICESSTVATNKKGGASGPQAICEWASSIVQYEHHASVAAVRDRHKVPHDSELLRKGWVAENLKDWHFHPEQLGRGAFALQRCDE